MIRYAIPALRRLSALTAVLLMAFSQGELQAAAEDPPAVLLARAEMWAEQGNLREAANILEQLVGHEQQLPLSDPTLRAALRHLTQIYYQSGDYERALSTGEQYRRSLPPDADRASALPAAQQAEFELTMAEVNYRLGRQEEAHACLRTFKNLFSADSAPTLERTRLDVRALQLEKSLAHQAQQPGDLPFDEAKQSLPRLPVQEVDGFPQEERYRAVEFVARQFLAANEHDRANALLDRELAATHFTLDERIELHMMLAASHRLQALACQAAGNNLGMQGSLREQQQALVSVLGLVRQRRQELENDANSAASTVTSQERVYRRARLLYNLGSIYEQQVQLARQEALQQTTDDVRKKSPDDAYRTAEQRLCKTAAVYIALGKQARELRRLAEELAAQEMSEADRTIAIRQANLCQDWSLCGLQRVYDQLRNNSPEEQQHVENALCRVSRQLVEERSRLLLPTDRALYDAELSLAYVYGSVGEYKEAADEFQKLVKKWEGRSDRDARLHAQALLGLADALRALDRNREARQRALEADSIAKQRDAAANAPMGLESELLAAQISNSLSVISISQGDYQAALGHLSEGESAFESTVPTIDGLPGHYGERLSESSRARVYRALLHQAEAEYDQAAEGIRQGRQLREQLGEDGSLVTFHLAEASVNLAKAKAMLQEGASGSVEYAESLSRAESSLLRAKEWIGSEDFGASSHGAADRSRRYLEGVLLRLRGDGQGAHELQSELCEQCDRADDKKTSGKARMELALLATSSAAGSPSSPPVSAGHLSRLEAEKLMANKIELRSRLHRAKDYAEQAVGDFESLETGSSDNTESAMAYPSLHFQAAYLAARLHLQLGELALHISQLETLLGDNYQVAPLVASGLDSSDEDSIQSNHRRKAIDFLEDAVLQAEAPASSTTHMRAERAKFFTRYAPAYDLLLDLYVDEAVGNVAQASVDRSSPGFSELCRAIEVADQARNRTFREQIAAWQTVDHKPSSFRWSAISKLSTPGTALLVYHLGGRQLPESSGATASRRAKTVGGSHLFVVLNGGTEIRYYRLLDSVSDSGGSHQPLTRAAAAEYVTCHIDWITGRTNGSEWGRSKQRRFTSTVLPGDLLAWLSESSETATATEDARLNGFRRLVIIPDGALHQLPFESLLAPIAPREESLQYLLDILPPLAYGPSLSVLSTLADRRHNSDASSLSLLTVGNPSYPPAERQRDVPSWRQLLDQLEYADGFPTLAHAQHECEAVYTDYDEVPHVQRIKLLQQDATEKGVRQYIVKSRVVHIAAHGCVNHVDDNLCGALVLARPEAVTDGEDDGLLQLREIYELDLSQCELAVLSACQTNVGAARPLEAGMSLARAFLEQGAQRVVCSQWNADDKATAALMKEFFARTTGKDPASASDCAAALWAAKRSIRQQAEWKASPRYWSAFVLVGL